MTDRAAVIVIGRNEGARLVACLASLPKDGTALVYVDSGSTDGSVAVAKAAGARVVELDPALPFTAARARNAGVKALTEAGVAPDYLQFVDGDCTLDPDWLTTAIAFLDVTPTAAVVCGRRRERHPEISVYNRLCDWEWDTPIGRALGCGGDAMMRREPFEAVGGFNPTLIAGEDSELCVRLRATGWEIWRIDSEMALHDAAMTRIGQWWKRARRAGFAVAEGAALHGAQPERYGVQSVRRALFWGLALPGLALIGSIFSHWALTLLLAFPAQIIRLAIRDGGKKGAWEHALFLTLGKVPEALGVLEYYQRRRLRRPPELIEYK